MEENIGLSLTPTRFTSSLTPGGSVATTFTLTNLSGQRRDFTVRIVPFSPGENNVPILEPNSKPDWLSYFEIKNSEISLSSPFTLESREKKEIILTVSAPTTAKERDYTAVILVTTGGKQETGIALTASIGSNLIITTSEAKQANTLLKINQFSLEANSAIARLGDLTIADSTKPVFFVANLANPGRHFAKTTGSLQLFRGKSKIVQSPLEEKTILSGSATNLSIENNSLSLKPPQNSFGLHQAVIEVTGNATTRAELPIFFIPFRITILALVTIIFMAVIFRSKIRTAATK